MELAQYYGGAPSGGAFSGGMMNPMYYGGARKPIETNKMYLKNPDYYNCAIEKWKTRASRCAGFKLPKAPRLVKPKNVLLGVQYDTRAEYMSALRDLKGKADRVKAPKNPNKGARTCRIDGQKFTVAELKRTAKAMGIEGYTKMKKAELCREINASLILNRDRPF